MKHSICVSILKLDSPLQYVKGVGPHKAAILAEHDMTSIEDLLHYLPRKYLDRTTVTPIAEAKVDQLVTIIGRVKAHGKLFGKRKRYEVLIEDQSGAISLLWFHGVRFWEKTFKKNQVYAATGVVGQFQGVQIIHPDLERLEDESDVMIHAGRIVPIYPQTAALTKVGLNSKSIRRITSFIVENLTGKIDDPLPESVRKKQKLPSLHDAIINTHYPKNREEVEHCRRRLAFEELIGLQYLVIRNKLEKESTIKPHRYKKKSAKITRFIKMLPFALTEGQKKAIEEIRNDLITDRPMSRILQGDVGCGKTIVAILSALFAAENKLQTAFMAPTEILAEQHFRNWSEPLKQLGVESGLLTAAMKTAEKKQVLEQCGKGAIQILFGTHALISDSVVFDRLGLVIIDEQHRFGVKQRSRLYNKGLHPDLLVMTATPIPRTLTLTLYGDLDISTIKGLPPGRQPIKTAWRNNSVKEKVYSYVVDQVKAGGQAYIIYPLIDKSERLPLESVEAAYEELSNSWFANVHVGIVHGRLKSTERDMTLEQFRTGELDILMATTVIEVGIDNPNATVMVIEHAERFGLAQLHQLRGRIGRGSKHATLVAIAHAPVSEMARQRLDYFAQTSDGFEIAEADLSLRGPGEIFGTRQSGLPQLQATRLSTDHDLLEFARKLITKILTDKSASKGEFKALIDYLEKKSAAARMVQAGG